MCLSGEKSIRSICSDHPQQTGLRNLLHLRAHLDGEELNKKYHAVEEMVRITRAVAFIPPAEYPGFSGPIFCICGVHEAEDFKVLHVVPVEVFQRGVITWKFLCSGWLLSAGSHHVQMFLTKKV